MESGTFKLGLSLAYKDDIPVSPKMLAVAKIDIINLYSGSWVGDGRWWNVWSFNESNSRKVNCLCHKDCSWHTLPLCYISNIGDMRCLHRDQRILSYNMLYEDNSINLDYWISVCGNMKAEWIVCILRSEVRSLVLIFKPFKLVNEQTYYKNITTVLPIMHLSG